jgi:hypothetical protein
MLVQNEFAILLTSFRRSGRVNGMVAKNQLEILESRVSQMIERLKTVQMEKLKLVSEVSRQEGIFRKLQEERKVVRKRLEKLLGTLNHVEGKSAEK